jgi:hypothetical protein
MSTVPKELSLQTDYCAFMVSIVLMFHRTTTTNAVIEWTADGLANEVNNAPDVDPSFRVNQAALHQAIQIFQRAIATLGVDVIDKKGPKDTVMMHSYGTLPARAVGKRLKFKMTHESSVL